ncbi:MAG: response regulator [Verrucomicrobia bacterium]|jgi:CheY-like chemotaxis protein|nr:response regulator [Verrucomicrobiota bacterium]
MSRILLIDDDDALRTVLARALTQAGYEVVEANEGRRAVECLRRSPVDVVVTDLIMPGQEGIETIMQLRRDHPALPVIAMSGGMANSPHYLDLARRLGARRTLQKPFLVEDIVLALRSVLPPSSAPEQPPGAPPVPPTGIRS